jgi:rifampicin phosphotransferase
MSNEADIPLILALDDVSATLELVGGKGASLARMARADLPIPPGFHITTAAYRRFVADNRLQEQIIAAVSSVASDQPATLEAAAKQIASLFSTNAIPDDIVAAILQAYSKLEGGEQAVAVRSSATAEDLPEMSFAGQQETYLNMRGEAMVLDAIRRCWASLWTARAISYRARHKIAPQDVSLAVVVQELVPADAAGILFTANPLTGAREQVMINAAWGLGEAIVSGQVTPDTVVVDKASETITQQEISEKSVMTVRTLEGTREQAVPTEQRTQAVLSATQAAELARIGACIEQLYGQPMDIEWAMKDWRFFIVQARPITALPEVQVKPAASSPMAQANEWPLPQPKGKYARSSVMELLPDPLTPLFASLGLPAWSRATYAFMASAKLKFGSPDTLLTTINGYGYYDASFTPGETAMLALAMPRIFFRELPRLFRTARVRWQREHTRYEEIVERWQATDLATSSAEHLLNGVREITDEAARHYLSVQSGILPSAYLSESIFTLVYNKFLKKSNDPSALTFLLGYDSAPIQAEKSLYDLAQWVRGKPKLAGALANIAGNDFSSAYQTGRLAGVDDETWSEFRRRFVAHLAKFGDVIYDLDFAKALPVDDPASQLETLKFFLSGIAPDPHVRQAKAASEREQAMQTMRTQLRGIRLVTFRRLLNWAQSVAPLREDALASVGLGWPALRSMLHEIGRRLSETHATNTTDDVFWLTLDELQTAVKTLDAGQPLMHHQTNIAERRATWERKRDLTPPSALPPKEGARFLGIDFTSMMPARTDQPMGDVLKGIAASPGQVSGPARVISGPGEFDQMHQGDILVARITTPAWTPLFALAAGIVTDVGGPLSHSSIVAREYHIPAVLGTGVATERLSSGERITVDGSAGTVTVAR